MSSRPSPSNVEAPLRGRPRGANNRLVATTRLELLAHASYSLELEAGTLGGRIPCVRCSKNYGTFLDLECFI